MKRPLDIQIDFGHYADIMGQVKKAIIPAAGLGTRFLPATKSIPKEMLPIVDAPIVLFVVEEAVRAGIEDIILIAGRGKSAIEDFFDISYELEDKLEQGGKSHFIDRVKAVRDQANIISIRQKRPLGLGHAVLCGQPIVGKEPFAVLLGDEIMISPEGSPTVTQELVQHFDQTSLSTVAVMEVAPEEVSKYGIVAIENVENEPFKVLSVVEKPPVEQAPSRFALPGRYVFESCLFDYLKETKPGVNGEIQLTDGMTQIAQNHGLLAATFSSKRYDAGDKLGYLQANIELALADSQLGPPLHQYLKKLMAGSTSS